MSTTSKTHDTLVVTGMGDMVPKQVDYNGKELEVAAWYSGHALRHLEKLEGFVEELSLGLVESDEIEAKAKSLLDEVRGA